MAIKNTICLWYDRAGPENSDSRISVDLAS